MRCDFRYRIFAPANNDNESTSSPHVETVGIGGVAQVSVSSSQGSGEQGDERRWHPVIGSQSSWPLQKRSSLHAASSAVNVHSCVISSQTSLVHPTPSLQGGIPGTQSFAASQVSNPLHHNPSSQCASLTALTHTSLLSSQKSSVQATPSSQGEGSGTQPVTETHDSIPAQNRPSSQFVSSGMLSQ